MPRVEFQLWNRVYILKLIATAQMTSSSFIGMLYLYLIILDLLSKTEAENSDVCTFRWVVVAVTFSDFGLGTLLAFAANMTGIRCRRRIICWIIIETLFIPITISLLVQLYHKIVEPEKKCRTYVHLSRIITAQVCFVCCHYFFICYAIDFLIYRRPKLKEYDPRIRPRSVDAPTDPQITTTESRHIRMCQSLLSQPSTSKVHSRKVEANTRKNAKDFESVQSEKDKKKLPEDSPVTHKKDKN